VDGDRVRTVDHLRQVVNVLTLATPLGLLLAGLGRARLRPGPHGTIVAAGYAWSFPAPRAPALTIGDVILLRLTDEQLEEGAVCAELAPTAAVPPAVPPAAQEVAAR